MRTTPTGTSPSRTSKEEPLRTCLADDLADVYRDLKKGLDAFGRSDDNDHRAVEDWKLFFVIHWGDHCASALRALNSLIEQRISEDSSFPFGGPIEEETDFE